MSRITRWVGAVWVLIIVVNGSAVAQQAETPYQAALLPAFVGDMAAYASAPQYAIDLTITLTDTDAVLTGHQAVVYTNRAPDSALDEVVFRLYPNLDSYGGEMQVSAVTADGVPVQPTLDATRTILGVPLPASLAPGASVTLAMDFSVTIKAGLIRLYAQFSYLDGVLSLPNAYPLLSVYEPGAGWWEITDHPQGDAVFSETSFYTVAITAPSDLILATSGSEVDLSANSDGTLTHHYVAPLMREFALFASTAFVTLSGEQDGTTVTLYYNPDLPQAMINTAAGLRMAQDAVRIYNATFGPYPFSELDVVQTPTNAGGIEYPGVFVVTAGSWNKADPFFEFVIAHEAAHEWWYSLVGSDPTLHPWMDEALAQYSVAIYIRDREGEDAYAAALDSFRTQVEGFIAEHADQVIGEPVTAYPGNAYFFMVYQKGPLLVAALDDAYGYEAVIRMLQNYLAEYRYGIAQPDDMLNSFEATLGTDLDPLFEEWVGVVPVG